MNGDLGGKVWCKKGWEASLYMHGSLERKVAGAK